MEIIDQASRQSSLVVNEEDNERTLQYFNDSRLPTRYGYKGLRWQSRPLEAVQESIEATIVHLFEDVKLCAIHRNDERVTTTIS